MTDRDQKSLVGDRVSALRKELGFTQKSLGDAAGIEREVVNQIERGKSLLRSAPRREKLAKAFGLTFEEFSLVVDGKLAASVAAALARSRAGAAPVQAGA